MGDLSRSLRDRKRQREGRLQRLTQLRCAIDKWAADGRFGRLPQPRDFGLNLPDLRPDEVIGLNNAQRDQTADHSRRP